MICRRDFLKSMQLLPFSFAAGCSGLYTSKERVLSKRPNILLFTADDLGLQLGCYGDSSARTPNMDKLAAKGVRFTTAYVTQSSCSPSRSSILTGLYPHQNGQYGLSHRGYSMHKAYPSIPTILKRSGYKTAVFGKLHVEPQSAFDFDLKCLDPQVNVVDRDVKKLGDIAYGFMDECRDEPFFMMFNAIDPHRPFSDRLKGVPEKSLKAEDVLTLPFLGIDNPALREDAAAYYNSVTRADHALGLLVENLKKLGKYDNTLIIVIGDNGPPFTRAKTTCYEAGLRTPFIISWANELPQGVADKHLISTVDILPTILDAANVDAIEGLEGRSVISLIKKNIKWREYLCGEYTAHRKDSYFPRRAVRDQRYKLIRNYRNSENPISGVDGCPAYDMVMNKNFDNEFVKEAYRTYKSPPEYEFYDLACDPCEFRNLIDEQSYSGHIERLKEALQNWQKQTNDLDPDYMN